MRMKCTLYNYVLRNSLDYILFDAKYNGGPFNVDMITTVTIVVSYNGHPCDTSSWQLWEMASLPGKSSLRQGRSTEVT